MNVMNLAEAIHILKIEGYVEDYNLTETFEKAIGNDIHNFADEFVIDKTFRFDVMTDPDDQSVLYALHSIKTGKKGLLVNGYGIYSDAVTNTKIKSLKHWVE